MTWSPIICAAPKRPPSAAAAASVDARAPLRAHAAGDALAAPSAVLHVQKYGLSSISYAWGAP